ncbi:aminotransferase class V-fold PLP-dependent enzyme [Clostridium magnum]|uniref:cysteine desulfurase n=1 Tax=Clostridium magnum DSM 2767 TaxID=1121326 RepID=A0A168DXA9_9CLOT|nr:aminotransferase class V-fold PLP-dependent enzyme [Clostridium magnum]KZL91581.1 putative cysteine desulfurase [Clostridium magnum DSM 2767]SHH48407.1 cysteine desulfurase family protein [Clostridium magnum DSM 2767]
MTKVYLDNGATSYPKAPNVAEVITNYITNIGCNINRGTYEDAFQTERIVYETRELICSIFNFETAENVIFTKNITESLNVLIKGLLKPNDHVIVSSIEHNAVMRPLNSLCKRDINFSKIPCSNKGELYIEQLEKYIQPNTKAVIMTEASNVCGTILPLKEVGEFCKLKNLYFIVDTAQSAGFLDIDMKKLNADAIAFTGHKGLLGPQGIGGFIINDKLASMISPLIEGGTGSASDSEYQPEYMPDKFESGTMNIPGVFGLNASLKYIEEIGLSYIREKELYLTEKFISEIKNMPKVKLIGLDGIKNRTAVVSLDFTPFDFDNAAVAFTLCKDFNILTRCGLHCAPSAHQTLGTFPAGTVRFSFGHANSLKDVKYAVDSIFNITMRIMS